MGARRKLGGSRSAAGMIDRCYVLRVKYTTRVESCAVIIPDDLVESIDPVLFTPLPHNLYDGL